MYKLLVLGLLVCQQVAVGICGPTRADGADTEVPSLMAITAPPNNGISRILTPEPEAKYSFHASQQFFFLHSPIAVQNSTDSSSNSPGVDQKLPADYVVSNGIGAYKVHTRRLTWSKARQACVNEGGHLAIIRTPSEERSVLKMMTDKSIGDAWVGYHDQFEEGVWLTVLDEPLTWPQWSKDFVPNPDNAEGHQNCARLLGNGGLDDDFCTLEKSFICKI